MNSYKYNDFEIGFTKYTYIFSFFHVWYKEVCISTDTMNIYKYI